MEIFPAQYSTLSSVALQSVISKWYGFMDVQCRLLIRNVSDTYIIETGDNKYIFKIYRDAHRKLDEIKAEVELLNILKSAGCAVAYPIQDLQHNQIQNFNAAEGTRYGVLFYYAPGAPVYSLTNTNLITLGTEMAKVHKVTSAIKLSYPRKAYTFNTMLINPLQLLKPVFVGLDAEYEYLDLTSKKVITILQGFNLTKFNYGYCHYDFLPKNFHYDDDGKLVFFDFDFAGEGYLANDIASFYIHYFMEVNAGKLTRAQADSDFAIFVEAYREVMPLSDAELKAIPYLGFAFWVFYLGFQHENFDDWSSIFFGPKFIKDRVVLIKKWIAYFE